MQDVENVFDASLTIGSKAPQVRTADHDGLRTHSNSLHDIATATNTAVEYNVDLVTNCASNCRKYTNRRRGSVEVVATVV
ncbi:unannotated protein [freshwater metagenome]|uniref:Unannotated protein n=1 Tax=freshwater metagenome TaxID=449393 RepID=A0A6J6YC53_9ZZZZ